MKILAIIPAKEKTKGRPSINLKLLGGKPLVSYTITETLKVKEIDKVIVSTEGTEMAKIAKQYGAEVLLRPKELAQDNVSNELVCQYVIESLGKEGYHPDIVVILQPTSPLRKEKHIKEAIEKYLEEKYDTLTTVCESRSHFYKINEKDSSLIPLFEKREMRAQRTPFYYEVGAIYITKPSLLKTGKVFGKKIGHLILDPVSSINIDKYLDFEIAERYLKKSRRRKICVITGTRADYGKLLPILKKIREDTDLELAIIATGMHFLDKFGYTVQEIESDGFDIDAPVRMIIEGDDGFSMTKSLGIGFYGISQAIEGIKPDIILVQGDRSEALIGAIIGAFTNIPVAHIEGGEVSGTVDESIRHAITKFSHIHFVSNKNSAERVLKLGERKEHVFIVGSPDLDIILNEDFFSKEKVEKELNIRLKQPTIIVLQHPVTTEADQASNQMRETMEALKELSLQVILIYPNADAGARGMIEVIKEYEGKYPWLRTVNNLNFKLFLSLMKYASVLVGNSSSGIREAPSYKLPAVNIGTRQKKREQSINVINTDYQKDKIVRAIKKALSPEFKEDIKDCANIYGDGKATERIINILKEIVIDSKLITKNLTY